MIMDAKNIEDELYRVLTEITDEEHIKAREHFFEKYAIVDVEDEGYVAVLRGFEEYVDGVEVTDEDELDKIGVVPSRYLSDDD